MKKIVLLLSLLALAGCSQFSAPESATDGGTNADCPTESGTLASKPEKITLASNPTRLTGSLQANKDVAYRFEGKQGQKLSFSSASNTVCAVVYSWDLKPFNIENLSLPADGEYTIQLSSLEASQTYEIDMGLDIGVVAVSPAVSSPPTVPDVSEEEAIANSSQALAEAEAVKIVQSWLDAKSKIFAPPFNLSLVNSLTVANGPIHKRTTGSSGSVQWLKDNGFYYTYRDSTINRIVSYGPAANGRMSLKVEITEDLSLYSPRGLDRSKSGRSTDIYEYILAKDGSTWKLYDSGAAS